MFKRTSSTPESAPSASAVERITSVLGPGVIWHGSVSGSGGVRIEGAFEGEIALRGLLVVGETGRVTCDNVRANAVIVAGAVRGNITTQKLEIRASGRVWGDVITTAFVTDEGAFLRGQIRMEESVELGLESTPAGEPAAPQAVPIEDGSSSATPKSGDSGSTTVVRRRKTASQEPPQP
jgi:cytoskeletal protein CcmA (bactofilin family)